MSTRSRAAARLALVLLLALPVLFSFPGCAPKKQEAPTMSAKGMDPAAAADYYFLLYQDLQRQGKPKEAVEVLEELVKLSPSADMYKDLANLYWGLSMPDKTREVLQAAMAKYPEEKGLYFYMANSYLLQRRFDDSAQVLLDYLAKHPKDSAASQELAAVYVEAGRFQQALDYLAAIPKDKRTPAMTFFEAKAQAGLGKRKLAIEKLRQALKQDPDMLAGWSELAHQYEKEKDYRQAEEAYLRILALGEDGPELFIRLMRVALKRKSPAKALEFMAKAPKDRSFLFEALGMFMEEGYPDAAAQVLARLSKEQPGNADVTFVAAMMAVEHEKNIDKGLELLGQIGPESKLFDKSVVSRLQLALENDKLDLAASIIAQGKAQFPDKPEFLVYESVYFEKRNEPAKAVEVLRQAQATWPQNTEVLFRLGSAFERMKSRAEALALMETILTLDPAHAEALNFVGYSLAEEGRDLDRAEDLIVKALALTPDNPYFTDSLAWVYFKKGDTRKAWETIKKSVSQPLVDPAIWEHYGDIALALGDRREAVKGYAKALSMNPPNAQDVKRKLEAIQ